MPKNHKVAPALSDEEMKDGLMKLYHQYDIDGDGHIDERELWAMLTEVIIASGIGKEGFTEEDAKTVMAALDEDGNGTVEKAELVEWVLSGLKRPIADRRAFAKTSPFASRLDQFLTACGLLASRFAKLPVAKGSPKKKPKSFSNNDQGKSSKKDDNSTPKSVLVAINRASSTVSGACDLLQLQCGLRLLFVHFNVSSAGTLDCDGVANIFDVLPAEFERIKESCSPEEINEITTSLPNICNRDDAPRVFDALDEDKSGSIDIDEFIQWFVAGSLRDPHKQVAFAGRSAFNLRLTHLLRVVVIIAQKLLPPSRIGDFHEKINETFQSACKKNKEALSPQQLKSLVEKIKKNLKEFECTFTADDADEIHRALDGDGDGVITAVEFSSWILRGAALSYQERNDFSSKSGLHKRMCNFLEAVCVISGGAELLHGLMINVKKTTVDTLTIEQLTDGLQVLFNQFDTDHSGTIDQNELQAMMIDLPLRFYVDPDTIPTADDVDIVMTALDADGSGEVDFDEWKEWVIGNRSMSAKQRQKFASQSKSHFRLNGFVETLIRITTEMTVPLGNEEELTDGLIAIFDQSATPDGHIGPDEIFSMVSVLTSKHPDVSWFDCDMEMSQTIADALDTDGNGTIEVDEWVRWMIRGANRPAIERAKFAAHNETFMLLTKFLEGISFVAKKLTVIIKKEAHSQHSQSQSK